MGGPIDRQSFSTCSIDINIGAYKHEGGNRLIWDEGI